MNDNAVKLWYYLKDHQEGTYNDVCSDLSNDAVAALNGAPRIITKPADVISINESLLAKSSPVKIISKDQVSKQPKSNSKTNNNESLLLDAINQEPLECIAYYLLAFSSESVAKIRLCLSKERLSKLIPVLDSIYPKVLPHSIENRIMSKLSSKNESVTLPSQAQQKKVEVLESLIEDSELSGSQYASYCLNPLTDITLFSTADQHRIVHELITQKLLIDLLIHATNEQVEQWLSTVSDRQKAMILDDLKHLAGNPSDYIISRNKVIECIRSMQSLNLINSSIKRIHD